MINSRTPDRSHKPNQNKEYVEVIDITPTPCTPISLTDSIFFISKRYDTTPDQLQWLRDAAGELGLPLHHLNDDGKVPWLDTTLLENLDQKLCRNCIIIATEETRYTTTTAIMAWENDYTVYTVYTNPDTLSTENKNRLKSLGIQVMSLEYFKSQFLSNSPSLR